MGVLPGPHAMTTHSNHHPSPINASSSSPITWIITDNGKVGTENQALGLAKALSLEAKTFYVKARPLFFWWPRRSWRLWSAKVLRRDTLSPPWPHMLITAGRSATGVGACLKRLLGRRVYHIALMDPKLPEVFFDAIIAPAHDKREGGHVINTTLSLHDISSPQLASEKVAWQKRLEGLPLPFLGVMLGGSTRSFYFSSVFARQLAEDILAIARSHKVTPLIIPSRRTPQAALAIIKKALEGTPHFVWTREGDNPYHGVLALADYVLVTGDSVQMISEAASLRTPLFVYPLPYTSDKLKAFHTSVFQKNIARPFEGSLFSWAREPYREEEHVANALKKKINAHLQRLKEASDKELPSLRHKEP